MSNFGLRPVFVRFLASKCMETRSDTSRHLPMHFPSPPGTQKVIFWPQNGQKRTRFCPTLTFLVKILSLLDLFLASKCMKTRSDTSQALANALKKWFFDLKMVKNGLVFTFLNVKWYLQTSGFSQYPDFEIICICCYGGFKKHKWPLKVLKIFILISLMFVNYI